MTYAELKRHADTGMMRLELMERYGETGDKIPARLRGIRRVIRSRSFGLELRNADGNTSDLRIEAASLMDYDGATLTVYLPGERELTEAEQAIAERVRKINSYWVKNRIATDANMPYLANNSEFRNGKHIQYNYRSEMDGNGKNKWVELPTTIVDRAIKGEAILRYRVTFEG